MAEGTSESIRTVRLELTGVAPLLMHSERTVNPFDPITKQIKEITSKRKKTDDDIERLYRLEWESGLYHDEVVGPYVPAQNVEACIREGARITRNGRNVQRGLLVTGDPRVPLLYRDPRDVEGLWRSNEHTSMMSVRIQSSRTMRCRPIFHDWRLECEALLDESVLDFETLGSILAQSGMMAGLCEFRPRFGRFEAKVA